MSSWDRDLGRPSAEHYDAARQPAEGGPYPLGGVQWTGGRITADQFDGGWFGAAPTPAAWPPSPGGPRHRRGAWPGRRWRPVAGVTIAVAVAAGVAAVFLTGPHTVGATAGRAPARPSAPAPAPPPPRPAVSRAGAPAKANTAPAKASPAPAAPASAVPAPAQAAMAPSTAAPAAPPLSVAAAQDVLAGYTAVNNSANARREAARLATIETGSSDAIDAGLYRMQQAAGVAPYPAFGPVSATYYIPRTEPAAEPRWFAVRASNAFFRAPASVASVEYLVFTQATPGGPWRNAIEPYLLASGNAPPVAVGGDGLATAVTATATSLAVAPGQLPAITAAALDRAGPVADPGNLADEADRRFWRNQLPTATTTDAHAAAAGADGETFALLTADGGALVFYTDAARLTITPPTGTILRLTISGLYSPAEPLTRAGISYQDQFAAYDPPAGSGPPRVIADYSGITGRA